MHGIVHDDGEVLPVLVEEGELEGVRDPVGRDPRLGHRFEAADEQTAHLLLDVGVAVGVTQNRQVAVDALDLVGHDVEVLGRVQRHRDAGHRSDRVGPLPGTVDHHLGLHVTGIRAYSGRPAVAYEHIGHPHPFEQPRPELPGASGQRLGEVGRVGPPVAREPDRAEQIVDLHQGEALEGLVGGEQAALEVVRRGARHGAPQLGHAFRGASHGQATADAIARRQARLGLEPRVELRGVLHQTRARFGGPQLADQPRGVPGGTSRERTLLE